jgi:hypothetical protein
MKGEPLSPAAEESLRLALGQYTARQLNDMIDFYCSRHPGRKDSLMFMAALACYREYMNAWGRYVKAYPQRSQLQPEEVKGWQLFQ